MGYGCTKVQVFFLCLHSVYVRRRNCGTRNGSDSRTPTPGRGCSWIASWSASVGRSSVSRRMRTGAWPRSRSGTRSSWTRRCTPTHPPPPTSCSSTPPRDSSLAHSDKPHGLVTSPKSSLSTSQFSHHSPSPSLFIPSLPFFLSRPWFSSVFWVASFEDPVIIACSSTVTCHLGSWGTSRVIDLCFALFHGISFTFLVLLSLVITAFSPRWQKMHQTLATAHWLARRKLKDVYVNIQIN